VAAPSLIPPRWGSAGWNQPHRNPEEPRAVGPEIRAPSASGFRSECQEPARQKTRDKDIKDCKDDKDIKDAEIGAFWSLQSFMSLRIFPQPYSAAQVPGRPEGPIPRR